MIGDACKAGQRMPIQHGLWLKRRAAVVAAVTCGSVTWLWQESPSLNLDPRSNRIHLGSIIPERRIFSLLNLVLRPFQSWLVPIDVASLMSAAQSWLGEELHDVGDMFDWKALNKVCVFLEERSSPVNRFFARLVLTRAIATHLRLTQLLKDYPEILQERIDRPLILTGPPRSGTTFFHKSLSEAHGDASDIRFLRLWEVAAGPIELNPRYPHRRAYARLQVACARMFFRTFLMHMHEWENLDDAEEESQWLLSSFGGITFAFYDEQFRYTLHDPHSAALRARLLRVFIQVAQWRDGHSYRWVLKSPEYVYMLDNVFEEFPSAKVVLLQRNPQEQLRSTVAFAQAFIATAGLTSGVAECRNNALTIACMGHRRIVDASTRYGHRATVVEGGQGTNGTIDALEHVSAFAGFPLTRSNAAAAVLAQWSRREQRPSFSYDLLQYGLTDEQLAIQAEGCVHPAMASSP